MFGFKYLKNVSTLKLNQDKCTGCKMCINVCPHAVFMIENKKTSIMNLNACMECGACVLNCPVEALSVNSGVGCAAAIIQGFVKGTEPNCCCGGDEQGQTTCC